MIRPARLEDAAAIARAHVLSWQHTYRGVVPQAYLDALSVQAKTEEWVTRLQAPQRIVHVAEVGGNAVGFAAGGKQRSEIPGYTAELFAVYLLPEHQGRMLGRALVEATARDLATQSHAAMLAWVLARNPGARRFYERLGAHELTAKSFELAGTTLEEVAYGWRDIASLAAPRA